MFWAGTFVAAQLALINQPVLSVAFIRNALSSVGFIIIFLWISHGRFRMPPKSIYWPLFMMSIFGVFLYTILVCYGLKMTTALSASLLIPITQPLFTILLSIFIYKESLKLVHVLGLVFGVVGAIAILTSAWKFQSSTHEMLFGNFLMLAAAMSFSIYSIFGKAVLKKLDPLETVLYSTILGTLFLFPFAFIFHPNILSLKNTDIKFWISMMYMVIFAGILPYLWWHAGVKILGASKTAPITFLLPPFALILSMIILHQKISVLQAVGGFLGLTGVILATGFLDNVKLTKSDKNLTVVKI
jgi:drug/metabolite transporter (DMT)-like permease